jgi:hypothetical protein
MATAIPVNLQIESGADWEVSFNLRKENGEFLDMTGYAVSAKMARNYKSTASYNLNATVTDVTTGAVRLSMPNSGGSLITKTQDLKTGRYVWNLFITSPGGTTDKVIEGVVTVIPGVL